MAWPSTCPPNVLPCGVGNAGPVYTSYCVRAPRSATDSISSRSGTSTITLSPSQIAEDAIQSKCSSQVQGGTARYRRNVTQLILEDELTVSDLLQFFQRLDRAGGTEVRLYGNDVKMSFFGSTLTPTHLADPTPLVIVHRGIMLGE